MINQHLFKAFNETYRQQLLMQSRSVSLKKGELLFLEGEIAEVVYFTESGMLKVLKNSSSGIQTIFGIYGPQKFLALSVLFNPPYHYPASGMAVEDTVIRVIPRVLLEEAILSTPEATRLWFGQLNQRLENIQQLLTDQIFTDVSGRFKKVMRYFAKTKGVQNQNVIVIELPLSKQEIAEYIGVRRETLSRLLSTLQKEGVCVVENKTWKLKRDWVLSDE